MLSLSYSANAQIGYWTFLLKGDLKGKKDGWIYLSYINRKKLFVSDSAEIRNGKFLFKGEISGPTFATVSLRKTDIEKSYVEIWLEPGKMEMIMKLNEFENVKITGSITQNDFSKFNNIRDKVKKKYAKQLDSLKGLRDMEQISAIRSRLQPYFSEMQQEELNYFNIHPKSYITAYWLRYYFSILPINILKTYYDRLGNRIQSSSYGIFIADKIKELFTRSTGSKASVFVTKDVKGKDINLADFKGYYVLLEFWASWCIPCRKEHPQLIELYNKYKESGVEFIGIADDDEAKDAWLKAINKDQLPWAQILRGREVDATVNKLKNDIHKLFGIQSLPTLILIDPTGVIAGRYEENIEDLKNDLKKRLNF